jgi:hypothetical protein
MRELSAIQGDYPDAMIHVHGLYSFAAMFGLNIASVDIDPRTPAAQGKVYMPHGKEMKAEDVASQPVWANLLGFSPADLKVPRNRCMFTMLAANWAGKNYKKNLTVANVRPEFVDPDATIQEVPEDGKVMFRSVRPSGTDRWLCDTCSIQMSCKFFREGAVCVVPDSEPAELATFFQTRDSETIITGLGTILAAQGRRANRGMLDEASGDKLDPEVTRVLNGIFDRGVKLAKLVDPTLREAQGPSVKIKLQQNNAAITSGSPAQLMAGVVDEFIRRGFTRDQITPEMIQSVLSGSGQANAIEATVSDRVMDEEDDAVDAEVID